MIDDSFIIDKYPQFRGVMSIHKEELAKCKIKYVELLDGRDNYRRNYFMIRHNLDQFQALRMCALLRCLNISYEDVLDLVRFNVVDIHDLEEFKEECIYKFVKEDLDESSSSKLCLWS